jgi:hypothetical protein
LFRSAENNKQPPATGLASFYTNYTSYIPTTITDMWETIPARSFANTKLTTGAENLCAITQNNSSVMIGTYYKMKEYWRSFSYYLVISNLASY